MRLWPRAWGAKSHGQTQTSLRATGRERSHSHGRHAGANADKPWWSRARRGCRPLALLAPLAAVWLMAASSNDPADRLPNVAQEARARALFRDIRCLVCQNQSIDESDADLAEDLRKIVRRQIVDGRSNAEIKRYLVDRYGEFVLERPALSLGNAVLWGAPFAVVLIGGVVFWTRRRRPLGEGDPLTPEEEAKLTEISSRLP